MFSAQTVQLPVAGRSDGPRMSLSYIQYTKKRMLRNGLLMKELVNSLCRCFDFVFTCLVVPPFFVHYFLGCVLSVCVCVLVVGISVPCFIVKVTSLLFLLQTSCPCPFPSYLGDHQFQLVFIN